MSRFDGVSRRNGYDKKIHVCVTVTEQENRGRPQVRAPLNRGKSLSYTGHRMAFKL